MGQNKAFLEVGGQKVIARVLDTVRTLTDDLFISTNTPEQYEQFGLRMVGDIYPDKATLGGIYSAIEAAHHHHVLVVACDMPFLKRDLLRYLLELAPTAEVVAPLITPPQPETTHAVYSKACLPAIEPRLLANKLRVIGFFEEVKVRYVTREEIAPFDPHFHSFVNMNTPEEWEKVKSMSQGDESLVQGDG
jgi:molybdopterin-guanine dinucleotide biosynthesis protein A